MSTFKFTTNKNGVIYITYNKVYDQECVVTLNNGMSIKKKIKHEKQDDKKYHHYINLNGEKIDFYSKDIVSMKEIQDLIDANKKSDDRFTDLLFQAILTNKPRNTFFKAPCTIKKVKNRSKYENGRKPVLCNVYRYYPDSIILHPFEDETVKDTKYDIEDFVDMLGDSIVIDFEKHIPWYERNKIAKEQANIINEDDPNDPLVKLSEEDPVIDTLSKIVNESNKILGMGVKRVDATVKDIQIINKDTVIDLYVQLHINNK